MDKIISSDQDMRALMGPVLSFMPGYQLGEYEFYRYGKDQADNHYRLSVEAKAGRTDFDFTVSGLNTDQAVRLARLIHEFTLEMPQGE